MDPWADPDVYRIVGAAMQVSNKLGVGFIEKVYERALQIECYKRDIPVAPQFPFEVTYDGVTIGEFRADFLAFERIIVELKVAESIAPEHRSQILNYLRASGCQVGLILNFGKPKLDWRQFRL